MATVAAAANSAPPTLPEMGELNVSNHLLGDQAALREAWERDGYWFFRGVLDQAAISRMRQAYVDMLASMGAVDAVDPAARCLGGDLQAIRKFANSSPLNAAKAHKLLHEADEINAFFERLFGVPPFWIPINVHRTVPPAEDRSVPRLEFIHADGSYNEGLDFLICWVPLAEVDEEVGGIAVVEGVHKGPSLHRLDGLKVLPIRQEDVPADRWRRTVYRPGDVLLMSPDTPHSGIRNHSDRFRLSIDTRILPSTGNCPMVGELTEVGKDAITLRDKEGDHRLVLDSGSFVRWFKENIAVSAVPDHYKVGDEVIVTQRDGHVVMMRPIT